MVILEYERRFDWEGFDDGFEVQIFFVPSEDSLNILGIHMKVGLHFRRGAIHEGLQQMRIGEVDFDSNGGRSIHLCEE